MEKAPSHWSPTSLKALLLWLCWEQLAPEGQIARLGSVSSPPSLLPPPLTPTLCNSPPYVLCVTLSKVGPSPKSCCFAEAGRDQTGAGPQAWPDVVKNTQEHWEGQGQRAKAKFLLSCNSLAKPHFLPWPVGTGRASALGCALGSQACPSWLWYSVKLLTSLSCSPCGGVRRAPVKSPAHKEMWVWVGGWDQRISLA